ncbi:MAG: hypothetical protein WDO73_27105 [Ignavibacteriota bacterium]
MAFLLGAGERGALGGNLAEGGRETVRQRGVQLLLRQGLEIVGEIEQGVERNNALRFQNAQHFLGQLLARIRIGIHRRRASR